MLPDNRAWRGASEPDADRVVAAFTRASETPDGWRDALALLAAALGARAAWLEGREDGRRWTIVGGHGQAGVNPRHSHEVLSLACAPGLEVGLRLDRETPPARTPRLEAQLNAVAQAVHNHVALESAAVRIATLMVRRTGVQPVVCTPEGLVLEGPEPSALRRSPLQLAGGRLTLAERSDEAALREALHDAATRGMERVLVLGRRTGAPLVVDVLPSLPARTVCFRRQAVLLLRERLAGGADRAPVLQELYGLTSAEAEVAMAMTQGAPVSDIAASRGVAPSTVRAQVKAILSKVGVGRQVELVQRLAAVC